MRRAVLWIALLITAACGDDEAARAPAPAPRPVAAPLVPPAPRPRRQAAEDTQTERTVPPVEIANPPGVLVHVSDDAEATLRVLDAETRAALPTARAYAARQESGGPYFENGHQVPGPATLAATPRTAEPDGRIALGAACGSKWYVVADGHAWFAVTATLDGVPAEVRLPAGGALHLSIPRWSELDAATVDTNLGSPARMDLPSPDATGELVVEGLLPGRHEIVVRRGRWFERGVEYGRGEVEIVAGGQAPLTIGADPGERRAKVTVTGTLTVPEAWGEWPGSLHLEGDEASNAEYDEYVQIRAPATGRAGTFEIPAVPEGRYRLDVAPLQWRRIVVAGPGPTSWDLDLGPPVLVSITLVDDESGRDVSSAGAGTGVTWHTRLDDQHGYSSTSVPRPRSPGPFVFAAQLGTVHVTASAKGYVDEEAELQATPGGPAAATLRLKRGTTLVVRLESAGEPFVVLRPMVWLDASGQSWSSRGQPVDRRGVSKFEGLQPGSCSVYVEDKDVPGWTCSRENVEVKRGETATVVLKLEKKP